jgi:hypothetical protein
MKKKSKGSREPKVVGASFTCFYMKGKEVATSRCVVIGDTAILYDPQRKAARVVPAKIVHRNIRSLQRAIKAKKKYHLDWNGKVIQVFVNQATGYAATADGRHFNSDRIFNKASSAHLEYSKQIQAKLRRGQKTVNRLARDYEAALRRHQVARFKERKSR